MIRSLPWNGNEYSPANQMRHERLFKPPNAKPEEKGNTHKLPRFSFKCMRIHELGHVVLYVHDLHKMRHFYEKVLGFALAVSQKGMVAFSSGRTHHELLLIQVGAKPSPKNIPAPGLYHIGLKIGNSDNELKVALKELKKNNVPLVGASDHLVTHSLYIADPEGNELELYVDVSDAWKKDPTKVFSPIRPLRLGE